MAYQAYLLRLWRDGEDGGWRISLQSVTTGTRRGFSSLESLFGYLNYVGVQNKEMKMTQHPNVVLVKKGIEAFNQGNPGALMSMIAEDAVFYVPGDSPISGEYRGKDAIGGFFRRMGRLSDGSQGIELKALLSGGAEHVVAIWNASASRKGIDYEGLAGWIFKVRDGRIVEGRNLQEDPDAIDTFWSA